MNRTSGLILFLICFLIFIVNSQTYKTVDQYFDAEDDICWTQSNIDFFNEFVEKYFNNESNKSILKSSIK